MLADLPRSMTDALPRYVPARRPPMTPEQVERYFKVLAEDVPGWADLLDRGAFDVLRDSPLLGMGFGVAEAFGDPGVVSELARACWHRWETER